MLWFQLNPRLYRATQHSDSRSGILADAEDRARVARCGNPRPTTNKWHSSVRWGAIFELHSANGLQIPSSSSERPTPWTARMSQRLLTCTPCSAEGSMTPAHRPMKSSTPVTRPHYARCTAVMLAARQSSLRVLRIHSRFCVGNPSKKCWWR
jgi:hypothetical protein